MKNLICVTVLLALMYLIYLCRKRKKLENINSQLIKVIKSENDFYGRVVDENRLLNYVKHDYKKHLRIAEYLEKDRNIKAYTGNKLIDAILSFEEKKAIEAHVDIEFDLDRLCIWNLNEDATISLLTNVFDNAIEAAVKAENSAYIKFQIKYVDSKIHLNCENSKSSLETPLENNLATTKTDNANHGYGTKIIAEIINNNDGTFEMADRHDSFLLKIVLPVS